MDPPAESSEEPRSVVCEPAATAEAMVSGYHVVGPLFSDGQLIAWLEKRAEPTR